MLTTLLWLLFYTLFMLFALCVLPFYLILRLFLPQKLDRNIIRVLGSFWGRVTIASTFSSVQVYGKELLPVSDNICFISNHQGLFDIPALLGYLPKPMGFIAKHELARIPILSQWMKAIHCVFIDRKSPRKTISSFNQAAAIIRNGNPVVIFPEGTRSRGASPGDFHAGSIKLALMAKAIIVPVAINGSWRIFEACKRIRRSKIRVFILPPITPDDILTADTHALAEHLRRIITQKLNDMRQTD